MSKGYVINSAFIAAANDIKYVYEKLFTELTRCNSLNNAIGGCEFSYLCSIDASSGAGMVALVFVNSL